MGSGFAFYTFPPKALDLRRGAGARLETAGQARHHHADRGGIPAERDRDIGHAVPKPPDQHEADGSAGAGDEAAAVRASQRPHVQRIPARELDQDLVKRLSGEGTGPLGVLPYSLGEPTYAEKRRDLVW